jgi:type IV pilus assembly protein PilF
MRFGLLLSLIAAIYLAGCQSNPEKDSYSTPGQRDVDLNLGRWDNSPANNYIELAKEYYKINEMTFALESAQNAISIDEQNPYAHNIIALIYQNLKQNSKADKHFRLALTYAPDEPIINNNYGRFLCTLGNFDKSLIHFKKTIDYPLYRRKWIPMTNIGVCALRNDNLEIAEEYLRKALQNNGNYRTALYNMIYLSVLQENYLSARAYLQRYLEVGQHNKNTLWWGVQTEKALGDKDALETYKLKLRSIYPDAEETQKIMMENY